jgi:hypothetical protein
MLERGVLAGLALSLPTCTRTTPAPPPQPAPAIVVASASVTSEPSNAEARPIPPAVTGPLSPILGADGAPATTEIQVCPVAGATLFLAAAAPGWRIGRLVGDTITWNALSLSGLPEIYSWGPILGQYPDLLWMRVDAGPVEYYHWMPVPGAWRLESLLKAGRRTSVELLPWTSEHLLAVVTDPESVIGEPAKTTLTVLPGGGHPALPPLPRGGVALAATSPSGVLYAAYSVPAEIAILSAKQVSRFAVPDGANCWVSGLRVVSSTELYLSLSECESRVLRFDGRGFAPVDLPTTEWVAKLVATADGTQWLLDLRGILYSRTPGSDWEPVSSSLLTGPVDSLSVSEDGRRLWVALGPEASGDPGLLLTNGPLRTEP